MARRKIERHRAWDGYWRAETFRCCHCKIFFPRDHFTLDASRETGLYPYCRRCYRLTRREYYKHHKAEINSAKKRYLERNKEEQAIRRRARYAKRAAIICERRRQQYRDKSVRMKRREQEANSRRRRACRLRYMIQSLESQYEVEIPITEVRKVWLQQKQYIRLWNAWRDANYSQSLAPVFVCDDPVSLDCRQFRIMTVQENKLRLVAEYHEARKSQPKLPWNEWQKQRKARNIALAHGKHDQVQTNSANDNMESVLEDECETVFQVREHFPPH